MWMGIGCVLLKFGQKAFGDIVKLYSKTWHVIVLVSSTIKLSWPRNKLGYSQYKDKACVVENAGSCGCEVGPTQQHFSGVGRISIS